MISNDLPERVTTAEGDWTIRENRLAREQTRQVTMAHEANARSEEPKITDKSNKRQRSIDRHKKTAATYLPTKVEQLDVNHRSERQQSVQQKANQDHRNKQHWCNQNNNSTDTETKKKDTAHGQSHEDDDGVPEMR